MVSRPLQRPGALYLALVHAVDGVRVVAGADSRIELVRLLAEYVQRRVGEKARGSGAQHVRRLLVRGQLEAAVELYFGLVARRRDEEWLVTSVLVPGDEPDVATALGAVARPTNSTSGLDGEPRQPFSPMGAVSDLELAS